MTAVELPPPFRGHRHATVEARGVAQDGLILLAEVGSRVHGTSIQGTDDRDELGVCVEPPEYVTGLRRFEQFERHTAWDRPGGVRERSGAGDLDVTVYGARKFCRLALDGNPSILTVLFVPVESVVYLGWVGEALLGLAPSFVSLRALDRYLGYLHGQRDGMTGRGRVNRPELIDAHGYDTKFAGHAVRLGIQGIELGRFRRINLPMLPEARDRVLAVRRGEVSFWEALAMVNSLAAQLRELRDQNHGGLPDEPDQEAVDRWLHRAYTAAWERTARPISR